MTASFSGCCCLSNMWGGVSSVWVLMMVRCYMEGFAQSILIFSVSFLINSHLRKNKCLLSHREMTGITSPSAAVALTRKRHLLKLSWLGGLSCPDILTLIHPSPWWQSEWLGPTSSQLAAPHLLLPPADLRETLCPCWSSGLRPPEISGYLCFQNNDPKGWVRPHFSTKLH